MEKQISNFSQATDYSYDDVLEVTDSGSESLEEDEQKDVLKFEFKVLSPKGVVAHQVEQINRLSDLFNVPSSVARQLLHCTGWDADMLTERFYDQGPASLCAELGIAADFSDGADGAKDHVYNADEEYECLVCCCDYPYSEMAGLACGHVFCEDCWNDYLVAMVKGQGKAMSIKCPGEGCGLLVDDLTVARLLKDADVSERYSRMLAKGYVEENKRVRWCQGAGCENAIAVPIVAERGVTCSCGTSFCFECGNPPHAPASCEQMVKWKKKLKEDGESEKWKALYTKDCPNPKCSAAINKDGGCQYMQCSSCKAYFCWTCMKVLETDHGAHNCNEYKEANVDGESYRNEINKFNFFFTRYANHSQSAELEDKIMRKVDLAMHALKEDGKSWNRVQYLKDAAIELQNARRMLMATYVLGFYAPANFNRFLFEHNQADLEHSCELLSQVLESKEEEFRNKLKVLDLTRNLVTRSQHMLTAALTGEYAAAFHVQTAVYK